MSSATTRRPSDRAARAGLGRSSPARFVQPRLILVLAVTVTFCQAIRYDFVNIDDPTTISQNPLMNPPTLHSLKVWWTQSNLNLYDPLTATVRGGIALFARVPTDPETGVSLNPWIFHGANILMHLCVTLQVYELLLYCRLRHWPACAGAMVFAIHPVQVEPVVWITSIKDLLYGSLGLLAIRRLLASLRVCSDAVNPPGQPTTQRASAARWNYLIATICFVLSMLSKPMAVALPILALPLVWLQCDRIPKGAWKRLAVWAILAVPFALIASTVQPAHYTARLAIWRRFLVAGDAIAFYLGKVVWPRTLMLYYGRTPDYTVQHHFIWWTWLIPAAMITLLWLNRHRNPAAFAGICIFIAGLLPVLGFVPFDFQSYSTVADRYLYLPMTGIAMIAASGLQRLPRGGGVASVAILALLAVRTMLQIPNWRDSLTLFGHVIDNDPGSAAAYAGLANAFAAEHDYQRSVDNARRSIQLSPRLGDAYATLGRSLDRLGNTEEAVAAFRDGFRHDPRTSTLLDDYTTALINSGYMQHALIYARLSIELASAAKPHVNLAAALAGTNDWRGVRRELETAISLDPKNYDARCDLAVVLLHLGDRAARSLNTGRQARSILTMARPTSPSNG